MKSRLQPASFIIGPDHAPLIIAVDDAWYDGNTHEGVLPLDKVVGIRQSTSLDDLRTRCNSQDVYRDSGDLVYLRCLVELCCKHQFRLMLSNFEYATANFNNLNRAGQAVLFDLHYANINDPNYGATLLANLLKGQQPKAHTFIVTGFEESYQKLLREHAGHPNWWILAKWVNPIVAKGHKVDMESVFKGFGLDFAARAQKERFQFWARPGDSSWTIVFDGEERHVPINVETAYLFTLISRVGESIHPLWLDEINEAAHADSGLAKELCLYGAAQRLVKEVIDLANPPAPADDAIVTLAEIDTSSDSEAETDSFRDEELPSSSSRSAALSQSGFHKTATLNFTPSWIDEAEAAVKALEQINTPSEADTARLKLQREALAALREWLPTLDGKTKAKLQKPPTERRKLEGKVQKAFCRARGFFSKLKTSKTDMFAKLDDHFLHALPKGKPRKRMDFKYTPSDPVTWSSSPPE